MLMEVDPVRLYMLLLLDHDQSNKKNYVTKCLKPTSISLTIVEAL